MASLVAVDVGVRTGLACYGEDGRLRWYRSRNFGSAARLRRAIPAVLDEALDATRLVLEGGGPLADAWEREGDRRGLDARRVSAEEWRSLFLLSRDQRSGVQAKEVARRLARRVIEWSGAKRPTSLTHDAAEAVMVGLWEYSPPVGCAKCHPSCCASGARQRQEPATDFRGTRTAISTDPVSRRDTLRA